MPTVACITMQRDEEDLLEAWIIYHGYLFGLENLYVFDNGSTSEKVRGVLGRFSELGVNVDYSYASRGDYREKGTIIGNKIKALEVTGVYDFFMPTDCDEFIILRQNDRWLISRTAILQALKGYTGVKNTLSIPWQLGNVPNRPTYFQAFPFRKTFFYRGAFAFTDHGHHNQGAHEPGFTPTEISHLHYHNRPFALLMKAARAKLEHLVDFNDPAAIENLKNEGVHLVKYFKLNEKEYHETFQKQLHIHVPDFLRFLHTITAFRLLGWPFEGNSHGPEEDLPPLVLNEGFDPFQYLERNPDVKMAKMDPLFHYCYFGAKEGRSIA